MQGRNACMKSRTCLYKVLQFFPVLDKWANLLVFPIKSNKISKKILLYSDRKPRARQKLSVRPEQPKICKCPTPGTNRANKCPAVARGGGGGGGGGAGRSWNWLMHNTRLFFAAENGSVEVLELVVLFLLRTRGKPSVLKTGKRFP